MKSKEALEILKNIQITTFGNSDLIESAYKEEVETIKQGLGRLEELEKENQALKGTNMKYAKLIDDFQAKNMRLEKAIEILKDNFFIDLIERENDYKLAFEPKQPLDDVLQPRFVKIDKSIGELLKEVLGK